MAFQDFQLFPLRMAIENVMQGPLTVLKWPKDKALQRTIGLLGKVGLSRKADAWLATLSAAATARRHCSGGGHVLRQAGIPLSRRRAM